MKIRLWRMLLLAQIREQPGRLAVTLAAIALGVALGYAVNLVNATALDEFGLATKRLVGEADIIVRGPIDGFDEALYPALARDPGVAVASPVVEVEAAMPGEREPLKILGVDPLVAAQLQPTLLGEVGGRLFELFSADGVFLSAGAARQLHLRRGSFFEVTVGSKPKSLRVLGVLSSGAYPGSLGVMDIASLQWTFERVGRLNRIDLRLVPGTAVAPYRAALQHRLPPGVLAVAPEIELDRAVTVTRAYRVNLNMLALVALWTGAFLVFSTQSLSVLRRRRSLALLRALGVKRAELQWCLVAEGAAQGAAGSAFGLVLGYAIAAAMLRALTGDLGNGQLHAAAAAPGVSALSALVFFAIGTAVAGLGAWLPARSAARLPPARALKGDGGDHHRISRAGGFAGLTLLVVGAVCSRLPALGGLPVFGYAAVGSLLVGAVLLVPGVTVRILTITPRTGRVVWDTAIAQLRDNVGLSTLSLAAIIVSFSLMVAMAIMVHSFRVSFEQWLGKLLPADLQLREPLGNDTAFWSPSEQATLSAVPGIARIEFRRTKQLLLAADRPAITLIARGANAAAAAAELPLVQQAAAAPGDPREPVWISESLQDLYGLEPGATLSLPLGGRNHDYRVAGVWRDYARAFGAVVMALPSYAAATHDTSATEASVWLDGRRSAAAVEAGLRATFARGDGVEIMSSTAVRERSLEIFDRAFAITYALEAIAVIIGLTGVSFAASSTALARRGEFGMLRHVGLLRRQVVGILASEGLLSSVFGVAYGLALGVVLSLVLVYVVNRQSFNWSIDLSIPVGQLAALSAILIAAAALTALVSGRAATSREAVLTVREDA